MSTPHHPIMNGFHIYDRDFDSIMDRVDINMKTGEFTEMMQSDKEAHREPLTWDHTFMHGDRYARTPLNLYPVSSGVIYDIKAKNPADKDLFLLWKSQHMVKCVVAKAPGTDVALKFTPQRAAQILISLGPGYDSCSVCNAVKTSVDLYVCMRCKSEDHLYCSVECQTGDFKQHQRACFCYTGRECDSFIKYEFALSQPGPVSYTQAQCDAAPMQPLDPAPAMIKKYPHLALQWFPSEFELNGEVIFSAPKIPPHIIHLLRGYLVTKKITWDYLLESSFFFVASHAAMPIMYLEIIVKLMADLGDKPNAAFELENHLATFWEQGCTVGSRLFDANMAQVLQAAEMCGYMDPAMGIPRVNVLYH